MQNILTVLAVASAVDIILRSTKYQYGYQFQGHTFSSPSIESISTLRSDLFII